MGAITRYFKTMKFSSLILGFISSCRGASLCGGTNLITATCSSTGFSIAIDETCRAAHYPFLDWSVAYLDGDQASSSFASAAATCKVETDTANSQYVFTAAFTECNIGAATDVAADTTGIAWSSYTVYLNFDSAITSAANGNGNLNQMAQTTIVCRLPKNFQENALSGSIEITDGDLIEDESKDYEMWTSGLSLKVQKGGTSDTPNYIDVPSTGGSIALGENVKLLLEGTATNNFNIALERCWASNVMHRADANGDDADTGIVQLDTTSGTSYTAVFYVDQCPVYEWVTKWYTDPAESNLDIELRQFAFQSSTGGFVNSMFYHCEVSVCLSTVDCVPDTCAKTEGAFNFAGPGRRRRAVISQRAPEANQGVDSDSYTIDMSSCAEMDVDRDGIVSCIRSREERDKKNGEDSITFSFSLIVGTTLSMLILS